MEFKSALWQCDAHDFDMIVELSEESFGTQYRHGPLSVTLGWSASQNLALQVPVVNAR